MSSTTNWHTSWEITRFKYDLGRHISHHHAHNLTSDAYRTRQNYISNLLLLPLKPFSCCTLPHPVIIQTPLWFQKLIQYTYSNTLFFFFSTFLCSFYFPIEYTYIYAFSFRWMYQVTPSDYSKTYSCETSRAVSQLHTFQFHY